IDAKLKQLKTNGLTLGDQEALKKNRLKLVWGDAPEGQGNTIWRKRRAHRAYSQVQHANEHVFLATVLAITPTECAKPSFDKVLEHLVRLGSYKPGYLNLGPRAQEFFESVAVQQGFSGSLGYLDFMKALFPQ
ncbi:hypothetical protein BU23DRAFT_370969, partial [Bimuria novae-zelandiae CBS 107.79]